MKRFEQEFLIRLAAVWFAARWNIMHKRHKQPEAKQRHAAMAFDTLGEIDYAGEMRLLCQEVKCASSK